MSPPLCSGPTASCHFLWRIPALPAPFACLPSGVSLGSVTSCPTGSPSCGFPQESPLGHCVFSKAPDEHGPILAHTRVVYFGSGQQSHQEFGHWGFLPAEGRCGQSCCSEGCTCATSGRPLSPARPSQHLSPQQLGHECQEPPRPLVSAPGQRREPEAPPWGSRGGHR